MPGCAKVPHVRKPIEQKSPLAAWATLARDEAGMSVEEVVAALAARGHAVQAATIRGIEGGSKGASVRLRRLLADVYGTQPPGEQSPPTAIGDFAAIERAITAQTTAIVAAIQARDQAFEQLLRELASYRAQQLDVLRALQDTAPRAVPMPADEPEPDPPEPVPTRSVRR